MCAICVRTEWSTEWVGDRWHVNFFAKERMRLTEHKKKSMVNSTWVPKIAYARMEWDDVRKKKEFVMIINLWRKFLLFPLDFPHFLVVPCLNFDCLPYDGLKLSLMEYNFQFSCSIYQYPSCAMRFKSKTDFAYANRTDRVYVNVHLTICIFRWCASKYSVD